MAVIAFRHSVLALVLGGLLAGCVDSGGGALTPFAPAATAKVGGNIEAPEVFQTTDTALWDGRPSLGGIWVASPDAVDPERVLMENLATGTTVEGALFRRERDNPGPTLQISSDAAEALGILAGQPVEIRVTALRRAEPQVPVRAELPPSDLAADPTVDGSDAATEPTTAEPNEGTAAIAAAALAEAEGAEDSTDAASTDGAAADPALAATEAAVVPKTAKERRAEARAAREQKRAAGKAAAAGVDATAAGAGVDAIESAPLDARSPEVSSAAAAAAGTTAETAAADASPAPTATDAQSGTARTIQIATFSQEANSTRAIADLAKIGVTAQVRATEVGGKPVWGITATGDVAMLRSIRGAGYPDAYFQQ